MSRGHGSLNEYTNAEQDERGGTLVWHCETQTLAFKKVNTLAIAGMPGGKSAEPEAQTSDLAIASPTSQWKH